MALRSAPSAVADELAETDAERACLAALRELAGGANGPIERHSVRTFLLASELGSMFDRELLLCAAFLHDAGLYSASDVAYVSEGRRLAELALRDHGWPSERIRLCADAVEHHHELASQWRRGAEVELLRRADLIDVSRGLVSFGVPRATVVAVTERVPRDGFAREVVRRLVARERPRTFWRIFRP